MLLAEAGLYRDALASLGATARQHRLPALGLHPRTEAVLFYPLAAVGLECTFRHGNSRTPDWQNGVKTNSEYKGRKLIPAIPAVHSPMQRKFSPRRHGGTEARRHGENHFINPFDPMHSPCDPPSANGVPTENLKGIAFLRVSVVKNPFPVPPWWENTDCTTSGAFTLRALDNFFAEAFRVETFLKRGEKVFHTGKSFVLGC